MSNNFNITVASWPGTGSTTMGLLLSYIYQKKYYGSGLLFRYIAKGLGIAPEGREFAEKIHVFVGYIDDLNESYSKHLLDMRNYVIVTKPLGFLIDRADTFEIFLTGNINARADRSSTEGREDRETMDDSLIRRQNEDRDRYLSKYGFDYNDLETVKKHHHLVIDASSISLKEEISLVTDEIKRKFQIAPTLEFPFGELEPKEIKSQALKLVQSNELEHTTKDAIKDIARLFPDQVANLPENIRKLFN